MAANCRGGAGPSPAGAPEGRDGEKGYFTSVDSQPFSDNSDHYYFGINGVPCMYFTIEGDMYQHYHTPRDTYEHFSSEKFNDLFGIMTDFLREY